MSKIPESCPSIDKIETLLVEICNKKNKDKINKIGNLLEEIRHINTSLRSDASIMRTVNTDLHKELKKFQ